MSKILVLGSNSPSGASFCAYAHDQGHEVIATSRSSEKQLPFLPYRWDGRTGVSFHKIDLNTDLDALKSLLLQHRPNYVVNFASQSMVAQSWENPAHWMQTNVVSMVHLLELLRNMDFLDRYLHFSTPEVYGNTPTWIREHRQYAPSTPYALSRAAGDMNVALWTATYNLPSLVTRAANVYGEGQQLYRIIPRTLLCCYSGQKLPLQGGGLSERAFIHFDDVSRALLLILERGEIGTDYHISPHESVSIQNLVRMICAVAGTNFDDVVEMAPDRLGKDQAYFLDSTRLMTELGWKNQVSLEDGLQRCAAWCRKYLDELRTLPQVYHHQP
jgi:dTDP-glucose 4,6-dehydratase